MNIQLTKMCAPPARGGRETGAWDLRPFAPADLLQHWQALPLRASAQIPPCCLLLYSRGSGEADNKMRIAVADLRNFADLRARQRHKNNPGRARCHSGAI